MCVCLSHKRKRSTLQWLMSHYSDEELFLSTMVAGLGKTFFCNCQVACCFSVFELFSVNPEEGTKNGMY